MTELEQLRSEIDAVDSAILELFRKRMSCASAVAEYKRVHNLPVFDPSREDAILAAVGAKAGPELAEESRELFRTLFRISRERQKKLLAGEKKS